MASAVSIAFSLCIWLFQWSARTTVGELSALANSVAQEVFTRIAAAKTSTLSMLAHATTPVTSVIAPLLWIMDAFSGRVKGESAKNLYGGGEVAQHQEEIFIGINTWGVVESVKYQGMQLTAQQLAARVNASGLSRNEELAPMLKTMASGLGNVMAQEVFTRIAAAKTSTLSMLAHATTPVTSVIAPLLWIMDAFSGRVKGESAKNLYGGGEVAQHQEEIFIGINTWGVVESVKYQGMQLTAQQLAARVNAIHLEATFSPIVDKLGVTYKWAVYQMGDHHHSSHSALSTFLRPLPHQSTHRVLSEKSLSLQKDLELVRLKGAACHFQAALGTRQLGDAMAVSAHIKAELKAHQNRASTSFFIKFFWTPEHPASSEGLGLVAELDQFFAASFQRTSVTAIRIRWVLDNAEVLQADLDPFASGEGVTNLESPVALHLQYLE
ncbi:hypothetical protein BOTBODRAFT_181857, partial [Botryobasidium botryosum FD-172 SS1]